METFNIDEFIIPRPKKEINFKNVGEAINIINEHGDTSYEEICRLLRNGRFDWTEEEVREYASKEKTTLCESLEEGLQNGDVFTGASIVVNCMHSPDNWAFCKDLTACDKELPGTKMWLDAHQEQSKTKIAEMKEEDYFLVCTKTLDGEVAKTLLLRAGVDQERIIECEANTWEAMDLPVRKTLLDLKYEEKNVHGVGITGQAPERCDDIVSIKMNEDWVHNEDATASGVVVKMFGAHPRVSEGIAVIYEVNPDKAIEEIQKLNASDSDKFALYHEIAKRATELKYIDPIAAGSALEREDRRALALFSEVEPIEISSERVAYTTEYGYGYNIVETSVGEVKIPCFQMRNVQSPFVYMTTLIDSKYTVSRSKDEQMTYSREELTEIIKKDRNMDKEKRRQGGEEKSPNILIKFGKS